MNVAPVNNKKREKINGKNRRKKIKVKKSKGT